LASLICAAGCASGSPAPIAASKPDNAGKSPNTGKSENAQPQRAVAADGATQAQQPQQAFPPCPLKAKDVAIALLRAIADGALTPYADGDACWANGRHPYIAYSGTAPSPEGRALAPVYVDDQAPFDPASLVVALGEADATVGEGPYIARFKWNILGPRGGDAESGARATQKRDEVLFYLDSGRVQSDSCALIARPPATPALRPACDARRRGNARAH
jgi:hypothetical protein